jgi:parallel beta-helix repeat protein
MKKCLWILAVLGALLIASTPAVAQPCSFTTLGTTQVLNGDCVTDVSIVIPDGFTLDGGGFTITAVDPAGGHFKGAVVVNGGASASVKNLTVTALNLANVCDGGVDRLRGIMFEGASGWISKVSVLGINQGPSGCQEGNAIEVRNAPFDGTHPATVSVMIDHAVVIDWQKTGIVANGDVNVTITHSKIGASATQANLAANSIQFGFGAQGSAQFNDVAGNEWLGPSDYAASAILLYASGAVNLGKNNIGGNAEIGIYIYSSGVTVDNNRVFDEGQDLATHGYDYGIVNLGAGNTITNNKVRGFDVPYDGVTGGKNKAIPNKAPGHPVWW